VAERANEILRAVEGAGRQTFWVLRGRVTPSLAFVAAAVAFAATTPAAVGSPLPARAGLIRFAPAPELSTNWAGYAVAHRRFTSVTGRWVQPAAVCEAGDLTYSAFWVGLGGFSRSSYGVEQTGTQANCSFGAPNYVVWYELFPAPPVGVTLRIRPGDRMSATVTVNRRTVLIRLRNVTTGRQFTKRLTMRKPDISSAEWIAEAPTGCDYVGNCTTLPLTNFGTVDFSHGTATVKGHRGRISDPVWAATPIELHGDLNDPEHPSEAGANAIPGALRGDGGSFTVSWQDLSPPAAG
jgi:Peptidase A4 family